MASWKKLINSGSNAHVESLEILSPPLILLAAIILVAPPAGPSFVDALNAVLNVPVCNIAAPPFDDATIEPVEVEALSPDVVLYSICNAATSSFRSLRMPVLLVPNPSLLSPEAI